MTTDEIRAKLEEHRSVLGKGRTDLENSIDLVSAHLALLTEAVQAALRAMRDGEVALVLLERDKDGRCPPLRR